jgi:hypothetical protein
MSTTIPITLTPIPVPVNIQAVNINDFLGIVCEYVSGSISQNVSFFLQGATPPNSNQGIFYNTSTQRFENWSSNNGSYLPITELQVGDLKGAFRTSDDPVNGWILLDGRVISTITGLTQAQNANLQNLFGSGGSLPNFTFLGALSGLPPVGTFSGISNTAISPAVGAIAALPISASYTQAEVQNLRNSTETLDESTNALQKTVTQVISNSETVLTSLQNTSTTTGAKWFVFCGYQ